MWRYVDRVCCHVSLGLPPIIADASAAADAAAVGDE